MLVCKLEMQLHRCAATNLLPSMMAEHDDKTQQTCLLADHGNELHVLNDCPHSSSWSMGSEKQSSAWLLPHVAKAAALRLLVLLRPSSEL